MSKKSLTLHPSWPGLLDIQAPEVRTAVTQALATKGKYLGFIKAKAPRLGTPGHAAWQAIALERNPYKSSLTGMLFGDRDLVLKVQAFIMSISPAIWKEYDLDLDRARLDDWGAW